MRQIRFKLAALGAATLLAACGSGGVDPSPAPPSITGLAATGAALSGAYVTARCAKGVPLTGKTRADGTFSLVLSSQAFPCMVQVSAGSTTLHGFAAESGHINITPLTDLVISHVVGSKARVDDATASFFYSPTKASEHFFLGFDDARNDLSSIIKAGLDAAKLYVKAEVAAVTGGAPSGDLLTGVFKLGDPDDKVLDNLNAALLAAGRRLDDLRLGAHSGGSLLTALARGSLVDPAAVVTTLTTAQIDGNSAASGLQAFTHKAKCDVKVVALNYNTVGVKSEKTNASGVMLVPAGTCTAATGLVAYAKGTDVQKPRTLVNPADGETFLLAAMYAAQGYAVVATDYLGFAKSAYAYHPYLHADSEATSVIDSIRAARRAAGAVGAALSGNVMLAGYSQGGHASMAAHRAIERDYASEIKVVAGAHMAGPYNLSGSLKLPNAIAGYQFFVPYLVTSWQKIYGNIYGSPSVAFKAPYDSYIETLLPNPTLTTTTLVATGQLPGGPGVSPNQARDAIFQPAFLADAQTNSNNPLFLAAKKNDLLRWNPKSAVLLCYGSGDPTVPAAVHQAAMEADFYNRGFTQVNSANVDPLVQVAYGPGGVAPTDPTSAAFATYYGNYHGTYVPPLCHGHAHSMFNNVSPPATAP